jgi:hypothetical protein
LKPKHNKNKIIHIMRKIKDIRSVKNGQYVLVQYKNEQNPFGWREIVKVINQKTHEFLLFSTTEHFKYAEHFKKYLLPRILPITIHPLEHYAPFLKLWNTIDRPSGDIKEKAQITEMYLIDKKDIQEMIDTFEQTLWDKKQDAETKIAGLRKAIEIISGLKIKER